MLAQQVSQTRRWDMLHQPTWRIRWSSALALWLHMFPQPFVGRPAHCSTKTFGCVHKLQRFLTKWKPWYMMIVTCFVRLHGLLNGQQMHRPFYCTCHHKLVQAVPHFAAQYRTLDILLRLKTWTLVLQLEALTRTTVPMTCFVRQYVFKLVSKCIGLVTVRVLTTLCRPSRTLQQ